MKKVILLLTSIIGFVQITQAQSVTTSESFDNTVFVPAGWSIKAPSVGTTILWTRVTNSNNPIATPHSGAGMARFRCVPVAAGTKQVIATKAVNYLSRGTSAATINFWMFRDSNNVNNADSIRVFINNTDSINSSAIALGTIARNRTYAIPDTQAINGWYYYSFSVPTSMTSNNNFHFIFEGNCESQVANQGTNMLIDDVSYDEFPITCSGTPNSGNVAKSVAKICGGTGSSLLSLSAPTNAAGLTYLWETSMSTSGPWSSISTNATATTGIITSTMYYRCSVNCTVSGLTYITPIDSVVVSSSPLPVITVTPSPAGICPNSVGVTITASGAATYNWLPAANLSSSTGASVLASPTTNTTYTVAGTDANGCSATTTVNVTISNTPIANITTNPNDSICAGGQVIMTAGIGGGGGNGTTYLWSNGVTTRRDTITVNATATYTVVATNAAGCTASSTITITALPAQNSGFSYVQTGATITFTDTTTNSTGWSWNFGDGNASTNQNPKYTFSGYGIYTVTLIVNGPCKVDTITKIINNFPASIAASNKAIGVYCYPNPTTNYIDLSSDQEAITSVVITNMYGKLIKEITNTNNTKVLQVSTTELASGMYILQVHTSTKVATIKVTKL
jgi:PKD repeat protein